jgi:DNA-binding MarR family transcriptional regulator
VDRLEEGGFVSSRRDAGDGRVRLVSRTADGDLAARTAQQAIEAVERRWRTEIGPESYDTMKQALRELGRESFQM